MREGLRRSAADAPAAFVSHGGVGTLLHCHLAAAAIERRFEQPRPPAGSATGSGGGYYLCFDARAWRLLHGWRPIDP